VAAQGVELSERPEARIERGLEASRRAGIERANETWDVGLKKHGQDLKQEVKRQLYTYSANLRSQSPEKAISTSSSLGDVQCTDGIIFLRHCSDGP
jgi:hypothetical protein